MSTHDGDGGIRSQMEGIAKNPDPRMARRGRIGLALLPVFEMAVNGEIEGNAGKPDSEVISDSASIVACMANFLVDHMVIRGCTRKASEEAILAELSWGMDQLNKFREAKGETPLPTSSNFDFRKMLKGGAA